MPLRLSFTLVSILLTSVAGSPGRSHDICRTLECKEAAETLMANMNTSADPCEDFFEYSCGGWVKRHPIPKTESHWNQFNVVDEKLQYKIRDILEEQVHPGDLEAIKAAKNHYKACMDLDAIEKEGLKGLKVMLERLGGWPMAEKGWEQTKPWHTTLPSIIRDLLVSPILSIYVSSDRKDTRHHVLFIDQPILGLPRSMLVDSHTYSAQIEAYRTLMYQVAALLSGHKIHNKILVSQAQEVIDFEVKIAKITTPSEMRRNGFRTYNAMTLRELQTWTDTSSPNQINWLEMIRELFNSTGYNVDWTERVVVREVDYLYNLAKLLESTPPKVIANYLLWRVIRSFSGDSNEKMRKLGFAFTQVFTGASQDQPRWKECVYSTNSAVNMAVGYSYVLKHFDHSAKNMALDMSNNIKWVFSEEMNKVEWMDEETRKAAKVKVDSMTQLIGYPEWFSNSSNLETFYRGLVVGTNHLQNVIASRTFNARKLLLKLRLPIDRKEWPISPAVVNAYYNSQMNAILFPAGILQTPFFKKGRLEALNYGSIGVVIGHEITHGFDDVGRQSDWRGNLAQWWSETTIETYMEKAQCFVDQYGSYRVPQLDTTLLTEVTVNGVTTLGENIADNGGLHAALLAYRRHVEKIGREPRLPGLEHINSEQLFFIAFAMNWCESNTKESLLQEILSDPHSPNRVRVLGTVHNSPDFPKVFNCPPVTEDTCKIW